MHSRRCKAFSRGVIGALKRQVPPIASPALVLEGITSGFRALPSDAQVSAADESLRRACFDAATQFAHLEGPPELSTVPDASRTECRALVVERGVRYLVSVAGYRSIEQPKGWAESTALGMETLRVYSLTAQVFDATNGAVVCEAADHERATSSVGVAIFYLPIPLLSVVDESAYWKRIAWNIGNKLRSCFLVPAPGSNQ